MARATQPRLRTVERRRFLRQGLSASTASLLVGRMNAAPDLQALVKVAVDNGCDIRIGSASTAL